MASRLDSLPPELLLSTFQYTPNPSDLRALCMTSKTLRNWAMMPLYHTITLDSDIGLSGLPTERSLLRLGNPGLAYVRNLIVRASNDIKDCDAECRFLRLFLSILPRNGLRSIECPTLRLDETTVFLLLAQQQKLESLYLGPVMCNLADLLETSARSWTNLTKLGVPQIIGANDLQAYQNIIKQAPHLSELSISCSSILESASSELKGLHIESGDLARKLLGYSDAEEDERAHMKIVRLSFLWIQACDSLTSRFDLHCLRSLCLWRCDDANEALRAITIATTSGECSLEEFIYDSENEHFFEYELVEKLLASFTGLKKLSLGCAEKDYARLTLDFSCLDGHKDTLQSVVLACCHIDTIDEEELVGFEPSVFATFTKLRYLAIPMPAIVIPFTKADLPLEYITTFQSLMSLPALKVLRILNWPRVVPSTFVTCRLGQIELNAVNAKVFALYLDDFVSKTLGPHIKGATVVCYGGSTCDGDRSNDGMIGVLLTPAYYVTETRTDLIGNTQRSASRTSLREALYVEPELDLENLESFKSMRLSDIERRDV